MKNLFLILTTCFIFGCNYLDREQMLAQGDISIGISKAECEYYPCIAVAPRGFTAKSGYRGTAIVGQNGKAIAGYLGTAFVLTYGGMAITEKYGISITRNSGISKTGESGTSITLYGGTAITGNYGISIAGNGGIASAGEYGQIQIQYFDGKRERTLLGYIGENGLKPNVKYKVENGRFVEAKD